MPIESCFNDNAACLVLNIEPSRASAFIKNYLRPIQNRFDRKSSQVFTFKLARSVHEAPVDFAQHFIVNRFRVRYWKNEDVGYCFLRGLTCLYRRQSALLKFSETQKHPRPVAEKMLEDAFEVAIKNLFSKIISANHEYSKRTRAAILRHSTRLIKNSINSLGSQMVHQSSFLSPIVKHFFH